jgi:hypothetical protein
MDLNITEIANQEVQLWDRSHVAWATFGSKDRWCWFF